MKWEMLKELERFTPIGELPFAKPSEVGARMYEAGDGFWLTAAEKKFGTGGPDRIEFGARGAYLAGIFFFQYRRGFESYFNLTPSLRRHEMLSDRFEVCEGIAIGDALEDIQSLLRRNHRVFQVSETGKLTDGEIQFRYSELAWDRYRFFFFDRSKQARLAGFEYTPGPAV
ncbi:hypothetical protein [Paenibacillus methanolicus]|uniref:Uncharacterized protein n=1 Tax=Paenibacillus methanolicus TaxID=582686 RepID=A0A5S5C8J4_9BACL|nr:hypothetical protein [Paenibacillus methanolicus]TYP74706.1 hypothetical protein BCM02_105250 [Paenibacillus methanolicus]